METITITAHNGTGTSKTLAGTRDEEKPTNLQEAIDKYGEKDLIKLAWESHVINVQRELRNGTSTSSKKKVDQLIAVARQQKADGDATLYDKLVQLSVIDS